MSLLLHSGFNLYNQLICTMASVSHSPVICLPFLPFIWHWRKSNPCLSQFPATVLVIFITEGSCQGSLLSLLVWHHLTQLAACISASGLWNMWSKMCLFKCLFTFRCVCVWGGEHRIKWRRDAFSIFLQQEGPSQHRSTTSQRKERGWFLVEKQRWAWQRDW